MLAGRRTFVAASGEPFSLEPTEIESLRPSPVSVMPDNLVDALSDTELADLLAYLGGGEE